ncbi:MAG: threonylcarbamoyl-AMP synthase [Lachnospiraceae bacterium]|nr:threonylcarbamoyl-AMP synthase [Lachnospiraceae bacterium]
MDTIYKRTDPGNIDMSVISEAGRIIRAGGLVAFPTETVYGLGADALNPAAASKIYEAKGRPSDNPLIVHIADIGSVYEIAADVTPEAEALAKRYWPGPLTMIFKGKDIVPKETTGGLDTVAIRFPSHPVAKAFIASAGGYVAAPSANISGRPSPTTGDHVFCDMNGRIDMIIDSGYCNIGIESTIIDLSAGTPMMLRPGYVSEEDLREVIGDIEKDPAVFGNDTSAKPKAPGMKYRHYAPKGEMLIVSGSKERVRSYIMERIEEKPEGVRLGVLTFSEDAPAFEGADLVADMGRSDNTDMTAHRLYDSLRRCDDEDIDIILSEEPCSGRLGPAIMNRLIKAAGHNIIHVD